MTDEEFARAFEACELSNESFHHRDHIRLAWFYLRRYGAEAARERMADSIRRFAAHHGKSDKYHHTMTVAWMRLVSPAAQCAGFAEVVSAFPHLFDEKYLGQFYSDALLASDAARQAFVPPDKRPF